MTQDKAQKKRRKNIITRGSVTNTMVKLINVKCEGKTASCNFYYEDDDMSPEDAGFVRVDCEKVLEYAPMKGYDKDDYCSGKIHAVDYLYKTFDMKTVPETIDIYWY